MSIGEISGQSGFYPAQAAAQYKQNTVGGINETGKMGQARQEAARAAATPSHFGESPPGGIEKFSNADESATGTLVYDPRDTNQDGKVSLQEELAYAAKQYSAGTNRAAEDKTPGRDDVNGQATRHPSISLKA